MVERSRNRDSVVDQDGFIAGMDEVISQVQQKTFRVRVGPQGRGGRGTVTSGLALMEVCVRARTVVPADSWRKSKLGMSCGA